MVRKYHCNDCFFDNINTEEKAYWLGFMEADGYIAKKGNCVYLHLARKDRKQLQKFLDSIQSNYKIYDKHSEINNKIFLSSCICISSKQMKKALLKHKKKGFNTVPNKYKRDFIRGLFDGDGSICQQSKVSKGACFDMLTRPSIIKNIQEYLMRKCNLNKTKIKTRYSDVWGFQYSGLRQASRIYQFLYDNTDIFMERKYQVFIDIFTDRFLSKESSRENIANEILIDCWKY